MPGVQFINHRAAQDAQPPRTHSDGRLYVHTVDHELVRRVIAIKRQKVESFRVEETKQ